MKRYIIKFKPGSGPDNLNRSFSIEDNLMPVPEFRIFPLYERETSEKMFSMEISEEKLAEINLIKEQFDRTYIVEVNDQFASATVVSLSQDEQIESIEPDEDVEEYAMAIYPSPPNDSYWGALYGLQKMDCLTAWNSATGKEVLVAVVDSGIDVNHPDLAANLWNDGYGHHGYNEVDGDFNIQDDTSHGTHVAGTIGAILNNGDGVVGVAPDCTILTMRGLKNGKGSLSTLLNCIRKAVDLGAKVINNSWGPGNRKPDTDLVLRYAYLHNVNLVFAAGNNGRAIYPTEISTYPSVICVASIDQYDKRSVFSNYGPEVTVAAPGSSIVSTVPPGTWGWKSGTSMAAPHVTGLIALLLSKKPSLTPDEIKTILTRSADPLNDPSLGAGRINANEALRYV